MKLTIEIPDTTRSQVRAAGEILAQISKAAGRATGHGLAIARGLEYTRAVYRALPADAQNATSAPPRLSGETAPDVSRRGAEAQIGGAA